MNNLIAGNCNNCDAWVEALDRHRRCPSCHIKRDDALEELRECVAMYRERVPSEVAEALGRIQ
jgi:Zn finger protein HypA/HybF involved in hydrogenase expression